MAQVMTLGAEAAGAASGMSSRRTRALLACGVVAGPLYIVVGLAQAFTRDAFDLRRHALSLLSNGPLGWIQITSFLVTGLLFTACAVGMRRELRGGRGGRWAPLLIGVAGLGIFAAGCFVADPADGFPRGTPAGQPATMTWHSGLHFTFAGIAFLCLIAACFVLARRLAAEGARGMTAYSLATGVVFLASWVALLTSPGHAAVNVAFAVGALNGLAWVSVMAARLRNANV
jgi:hypothetical membrane protein